MEMEMEMELDAIIISLTVKIVANIVVLNYTMRLLFVSVCACLPMSAEIVAQQSDSRGIETNFHSFFICVAHSHLTSIPRAVLPFVPVKERYRY